MRSFDAPTKCDACTSVMFGLVRQGMMCKSESSLSNNCYQNAICTCMCILFINVKTIGDEDVLNCRIFTKFPFPNTGVTACL